MTDSTKPTSMRYRREVNVANNTLASILERYNGILEQVLQRIDILEQGQKLDRKTVGTELQQQENFTENVITRLSHLEMWRSEHTKGYDSLVGSFIENKSKVEGMDEKLTARVNDIDERMKVSPGGDIGAQMLEVLDDNGGRFSETLAEISREAARDVLDNFDFEYHHVERAVEDAVERIDLSDMIDWDSLHASQFDLRDFAECLVEESPFSYPLRCVEEHEERLDKMGDQMCSVIGMLEAIGIATEPSSHTALFGDKRNVHQTFGDLVAKMSEEMSPDDRAEHLNLMRDTVAKNVAKGDDSEEN